ncbi:Tudor domain-containing protein 6 [Manis javanica]|nr:Tudor domain-containing protein 6 [Manis javanica]
MTDQHRAVLAFWRRPVGQRVQHDLIHYAATSPVSSQGHAVTTIVKTGLSSQDTLNLVAHCDCHIDDAAVIEYRDPLTGYKSYLPSAVTPKTSE